MFAVYTEVKKMLTAQKAHKWNEPDKIPGDVIWIKGNGALQNEANRIYLRRKLDEGARIYFIKKGISVEDVFSYLGIKDYKIKTSEGASPDRWNEIKFEHRGNRHPKN